MGLLKRLAIGAIFFIGSSQALANVSPTRDVNECKRPIEVKVLNYVIRDTDCDNLIDIVIINNIDGSNRRMINFHPRNYFVNKGKYLENFVAYECDIFVNCRIKLGKRDVTYYQKLFDQGKK